MVLCLGLSIICHLKFIAMTTIAMKLICGPLGSYFTLCSIWSFLSVSYGLIPRFESPYDIRAKKRLIDKTSI